ncbi:hypothetical protein JCM10207_002331 [Rhodosporidiobolus poonsookiae]
MYPAASPSSLSVHHFLPRPSSRASQRSHASQPHSYSTEPSSRPSSAGSSNRSLAQRGSLSPYDDDTPSSSPTPLYRATDTAYSHPAPPAPLPRLNSGPRLPPVAIGSPLVLDSCPSSIISTASTTRKPRPPSIHMTSASPPRQHGMVRHSLPSRTSRQFAPGDSSSDDDAAAAARRSSLMPRSAVANYFNLDFSFLDEEPPSRPSSFGGIRRPQSERRKDRPVSRDVDRLSPAARGRDADDYFSMQAGGKTASRNRDSISSTQSLPFPSKPFPSRPPVNRRISSESVASRRSSLYSPGERPYVPSGLGHSLDSTRRPSMASFMSVNSSDSAPSLMYQARATPPVAFPAPVETGTEAAEKRKRLAAFLDETAAAMEGGKSLAMVLPQSQPTTSQHKSLSELAEEHTVPPPRPTSRASTNGQIEYRHPFGNSSFTNGHQAVDDDAQSPTSGAPTTFDPATYSAPPSPTDTGARPAPPPVPAVTPAEPVVAAPEPASESQQSSRDTLYFTPDPQDRSPKPPASESAESENEGRAMTLGEALMLDRDPSGLGLAGVKLGAPEARPTSERSPSTIRAGSPASVAASQMQAVETAAEKAAKRQEKRARTIRELIETETSYAVDMAVVRDIYLARARGAHMAQIADHVMSTGLGLGSVGPGSPASPALGSSSILEARRASAMPGGERRVSSAPSFNSSKLSERRPTVVPAPALMPGQPLMSSKDLHIVFANLEEVAQLSEEFAGALDRAVGGEEAGAMDDRIGEVFVEMIPRIQQVYSTYCARHHRAILRLQELEPTLRTYLSECQTLSHGRTNAWDLASLLIKPVQRCLKYPLLLDQILALTPEFHPDLPLLQRANTDMLMVAEHINEYKKRNDVVARVVAKEKNSQRRDSARSISAMGTTVTKKFLRTSQKAKTALGFPENGGDEMFDTLVALVDSTRSGVLRFSNEMREWTKTTKGQLEAQVSMVEGWINMYAPMANEHNGAGVSHERLTIFLDEVLIPIIEGPWRELDHEVRRSLILKTDHLLSLFESPRQVIGKRNDKMLDHHRYLAKKLPADRRGSEDFLVLSAQLLEELPRFLGSVSRYFNIIVGHFAGAQAAYHEAVQERWNAFAEQYLSQIPDGSYDDIEATFAAQHQPLAQMMDTLAVGLGLSSSQSNSPSNRKRGSRISHISTNSTLSSAAPSRLSISHSRMHSIDDRRSVHRQSFMSAATDYSADPRGNRGSVGSNNNRNSVTSDSSAPSCPSADGSTSTAGPVTPPPTQPHFRPQKGGMPHDAHRQSVVVVHEPLGGYDRRSMAIRYDAPLPSVPPVQNYHSDSSERSTTSTSEERPQSYHDVARPREVVGRSAADLRDKYLSTYSAYVPAEDGYDEDDFGEGPLYIAEAVTASQADSFRSGYPVLSFEVGDRFNVELEEADRAEGGSGWLLGRKVGDDSGLGWARTEHFVMIDDGTDELEGEAH